MKVKLSKPLVLVQASGTTPAKEVQELELDLDSLTGADFLFCEREASVANGGVPIIEKRLDGEFLLLLAARASGQEAEVLRKLPIRDFGALIGALRDFFLAGD